MDYWSLVRLRYWLRTGVRIHLVRRGFTAIPSKMTRCYVIGDIQEQILKVGLGDITVSFPSATGWALKLPWWLGNAYSLRVSTEDWVSHII
jgi:hypothetical protein